MSEHDHPLNWPAPNARDELAEGIASPAPNPFAETVETKDGIFPRAYVEYRRAEGLPLVARTNEEIYDLLREVNERLKQLGDRIG